MPGIYRRFSQGLTARALEVPFDNEARSRSSTNNSLPLRGEGGVVANNKARCRSSTNNSLPLRGEGGVGGQRKNG